MIEILTKIRAKIAYPKSKFFITYKKLLSNIPSVTSTNFRAKESPTEK